MIQVQPASARRGGKETMCLVGLKLTLFSGCTELAFSLANAG